MKEVEKGSGSPEPKPWLQALFIDVPHVVDSIWRWSEFAGSCLGKVGLVPPHAFEVRPLRSTPVYWQFLVISICLVFGLTFDSLCTGFGYGFASLVRLVAGFALGLATARLLYYLLGEVFKKVAGRAEDAGYQIGGKLAKEALDAPPPPVSTMDAVMQGMSNAGQSIKSIPGLIAIIGQCISAVFALQGAAFKRVLGALIGLVIGAFLVALPFALASVALFVNPFDEEFCRYDPDRAISVYGQVGVLIALIVAARITWSGRLKTRGRRELLFVMLAWAVAVVLLWTLFLPDHPAEALGGAYRQTYPLLLGCLMVIAFGTYWLAGHLFREVEAKTGSSLRGRLTQRELFPGKREDPPISGLRILAAFVNGVVYRPFHVLLLPSLVCVLANTGYQWAFATMATALAVLGLTYGSLSTRWEQMVLYMQRWFLAGTPLLVSLLVMALAVMRLADVQYVSTVLDAAPFGVIFVSIILAYVTFWHFEYWVNRWLAERLLGLLGAPDDGVHGFMAYEYVPPPPPPPAPPPTGAPELDAPQPARRNGVALANRQLAIHGTGRFCVQGWFKREKPRKWEQSVGRAFHTFGLLELFELIAGDDKDAVVAVHDVGRRIRFYFGTVNIALLATLIGLLSWQHGWKLPLASYRVVSANAHAGPAAGNGDLAAMLRKRAAANRPAIVVAASGGGTRAALYTATALEGLARLDRTQDIVMLSGVSGGGVAVAYFASRFDTLGKKSEAADKNWKTFRDAVTEPFIQDVLEGMDELRVAGDVPLGELLVESLSRRAFDRGEPEGTMRTFASIGALPLILNTTMSGHPSNESTLLDQHVGVLSDRDKCLAASQPFASLAGGRLIFTNLSDKSGFPTKESAMPDVRMVYRVVRDPTVPLAAAAALNANFPPVFSNARVRLETDEVRECKALSYFVTDGGATENLGLVSALYALRKTVLDWPAGEPLPPLHVVAIEASAVTYDYSQDRGVGAATGGSKERINGGLTEELIHSIDAELARRLLPALQVHYLPLPMAFRSRGGFGTHWMYAKQIRVTSPLPASLPGRIGQFWGQRVGGKAYYEVLDQESVAKLWDAMFSTQGGFCGLVFDQRGPQRVAGWICGRDERSQKVAQPDWQVGAWDELLEQLGPKKAPPPVSPGTEERGAGTS